MVYNIGENMKLIITMTSWKARINNVTKVLDSIAANTLQPDIVELNLSSEEFPNNEKDLPEELVNYKKINLKIYWTKINTKAFKKLIPSIIRHQEEDCMIVTIDDDVIYPDYFLQDFVLAANANPESIISNNMCRGTFFNQQCVNGAATLYRPKFFTSFLWEGLIKQVIETNEDDQWYTFCIWLFGQRPVKYIPLKMLFFNEVGEHQYTNGNARNILLNYWRLLINKKEILKDDGTTEIVFINPQQKENNENGK